MKPKELEIKMIESRIKEIFAKDYINKEDEKRGLYFLEKWKNLNNYKDE